MIKKSHTVNSLILQNSKRLRVNCISLTWQKQHYRSNKHKPRRKRDWKWCIEIKNIDWILKFSQTVSSSRMWTTKRVICLSLAPQEQLKIKILKMFFRNKRYWLWLHIQWIIWESKILKAGFFLPIYPGPIKRLVPNAKKYAFFPILMKKGLNLRKKFPKLENVSL